MSGHQGSTNEIKCSNHNIAPVHSGSGKITGNISQYIVQNIDDINRLIERLHSKTQEFPREQREDALTHLDDLQDVISKPDKQKPSRIKALLRALLAVGTGVAGGTDFCKNALELAEKLGVPIDFVQSQPAQPLPPSALPQIDLQAHGIDKVQAEILRTNLATFSNDWHSPEMSIYDDYDSAKADRKAR